MTHRIKTVQPREDLHIVVVFQNGVEKLYDIKRLFSVFPQFKKFEEDEKLFETVKVDVGGYGISWNDELDLSAEEIWEDGVTLAIHEVDPLSELAVSLITARKKRGLSQKELATVTGVYQADISKIERGLANPSILTLQKLAKGLEMKLCLSYKEE